MLHLMLIFSYEIMIHIFSLSLTIEHLVCDSANFFQTNWA
jgi:hypothetical protein